MRYLRYIQPIFLPRQSELLLLSPYPDPPSSVPPVQLRRSVIARSQTTPEEILRQTARPTNPAINETFPLCFLTRLRTPLPPPELSLALDPRNEQDELVRNVSHVIRFIEGGYQAHRISTNITDGYIKN